MKRERDRASERGGGEGRRGNEEIAPWRDAPEGLSKVDERIRRGRVIPGEEDDEKQRESDQRSGATEDPSRVTPSSAEEEHRAAGAPAPSPLQRRRRRRMRAEEICGILLGI